MVENEAKRGPGYHYREPLPYDIALEGERRKKRMPVRGGIGPSTSSTDPSLAGYGGGAGVLCLMLPWGERIKQYRVMQSLQVCHAIYPLRFICRATSVVSS